MRFCLNTSKYQSSYWSITRKRKQVSKKLENVFRLESVDQENKQDGKIDDIGNVL